jgi:hypothetical protein
VWVRNLDQNCGFGIWIEIFRFDFESEFWVLTFDLYPIRSVMLVLEVILSNQELVGEEFRVRLRLIDVGLQETFRLPHRRTSMQQ